MTDQELKALVASLAAAQKETGRQMKETDRQMKETDRQMKETDRQMKETDRKLKELGKQVGGLNNKFGEFAEGMAMPSLIEILGKRFNAHRIIETRLLRKHDEEIELDLIAATNGARKAVVAAEVKSILNKRELDKFTRNLGRFFDFLPEFRGYRLYGVLAAIKSTRQWDQATIARGIALARMHGEVFQLDVPPDFEPKDFSK